MCGIPILSRAYAVFDAVSSVKMLFRRSLVPVRSLLKLDLVVTNVGQIAFSDQCFFL